MQERRAGKRDDWIESAHAPTWCSREFWCSRILDRCFASVARGDGAREVEAVVHADLQRVLVIVEAAERHQRGRAMKRLLPKS